MLRVDDRGLTRKHFDALVMYNQRNGDQFFTVRHQALRFRSYVGVLQVGRLTIEVLPKVDRSGVADKMLCRNALIGMLRYCGYLRAKLPTWAELHLQETSLLDLYLEAFLSEVDDLVRQGLAKRYRRDRRNLTSLKGRLVFGEHITRNSVHKERFYADHDRYDWDNEFNRVLKRAASITATIAMMIPLCSRARFVSQFFEGVSDVPMSAATFDRLRYDRKTERYRRAIALARLIILNYQPDVRAGGQNVLAILCNMNDLFEQYVLRRLRQAASRRRGIQVRGQTSHLFWRTNEVVRHIRPDIELQSAGQVAPMVLDTKWKVPNEPYPSDGDLKQMFAYSARLRAENGFLLYPRIDDRADIVGTFEGTDQAPARRCCMLFIDLFKDGRLDPNLGDAILKQLTV